MRELPWTERFDRVVNWFTAFGYFDDTGNRRVLAEVARALRPGGRVAIELNNYPAIMRTYLPSTVVERDGNLMIDRHRFDPLTGRNLVERTIIRDSLVRRTHFEVRMFTYPELRDWLLEAGFRGGGRLRRGWRAVDRATPPTHRHREPSVMAAPGRLGSPPAPR
jgi:SAM-dependent methyltransferase